MRYIILINAVLYANASFIQIIFMNYLHINDEVLIILYYIHVTYMNVLPCH